ncbi:MAG TPA: MFS transporter [Jatrophihabitans sp.]|jgi:MFS family permease|uniref:MFS transporter n=1 Tax=Jatrophihabitans sp. TaxID=1932789 RepID=UPI002EF63DB3
MDRLPWSKFHWRVVIALGITWVLDGIEITVAGAIGERLTEEGTLHFTAGQIGLAASIYLLGEVVGALYFGRLADKLGRRKLFIITLGVYLIGNLLTAFSFNFLFFIATRFIAGLGIGGEYAAINSAIDELIPADYRGRVDLAINGTYWLGAMIGAAANIAFLNPDLFDVNLGWRLGLLIGPLIGIAVWGLRRHIPESPRWLLTHGQSEEAERIVDGIEGDIKAGGVTLAPVDPSDALLVEQREEPGYKTLAQLIVREYPSRAFLGFMLMVTQSFLYNAIFFTFALILGKFYGISGGAVGYFIFPFAVGNLLGPLLLGKLFDTVGRRIMIGSTYCSSAILLFITGWLFKNGSLNATTQTILWCVIFFIASAAASSAYLTVSEIFPLEVRAKAISLFFAVSQFFGGVIAPFLFGKLIDAAGTGDVLDRDPLFWGYTIGAVLMFLGGLTAFIYGVNAERQSLESIAKPLSARHVAMASGGASRLTGGLGAGVRRDHGAGVLRAGPKGDATDGDTK